MKTYAVYMLLCRDGSYYTGVTSQLESRLAQHRAGTIETCYTFRRRPLELVHVSVFPTAIEAIAAEKIVKRWTRAKKAAFVRGGINEVRAASHGAAKRCDPA